MGIASAVGLTSATAMGKKMGLAVQIRERDCDLARLISGE
jgi:hypothetical protein